MCRAIERLFLDRFVMRKGLTAPSWPAWLLVATIIAFGAYLRVSEIDPISRLFITRTSPTLSIGPSACCPATL